MATTFWTVLSPCSCLGCVITGQNILLPPTLTPESVQQVWGGTLSCVFLFSLFGHVYFFFP